MLGARAFASDSPATRIPADPRRDRLEKGVALCLSGGGYRAMLFHVGSLWRLNEFGYLRTIDRVSSVSGGSITAAVLGMNWSHLIFGPSGIADGFERAVVDPIRSLACETLDVDSVLLGKLLPGSVGDKLSRAYRKHLFGDRTLQDLPDFPRFVINATNVQTGALFRFSKPYCADYRVGRCERPHVRLSDAVAASSAFPPVLSPMVLRFEKGQFQPAEGVDLHDPSFAERVVLTDGGVYDNLGLETAWKRYETILVSDAGGKMQPERKPAGEWVRHAVRINGLIDNQVRSLRKRQLIDAFERGDRQGAYWGIRTDVKNYHLRSALECPFELTTALANTPTRLQKMKRDVQERLINWGYAVCDTAMRKYVIPDAPRPGAFPYPKSGLG